MRPADHEGTAIEALASFLESSIQRRDELIMPLSGGPVSTDREAIALRTEISETLAEVVTRGIAEGSIRGDATSIDLIIAGALLAHPLPNAPEWDRLARRQAAVFLDGLGVDGGDALPGDGPTRADLERGFARAKRSP